jgi:hypothetical protein
MDVEETISTQPDADSTIPVNDMLNKSKSLRVKVAMLSRFAKAMMVMRLFDLLSDLFLFCELFRTTLSRMLSENVNGLIESMNLVMYLFLLIMTLLLYRSTGLINQSPEMQLSEDIIIPFMSAMDFDKMSFVAKVLIVIEFVMVSVNCYRSKKTIAFTRSIRIFMLIGLAVTAPMVVMQAFNTGPMYDSTGTATTGVGMIAKFLLYSVVIPDLVRGKTSVSALIVLILTGFLYDISERDNIIAIYERPLDYSYRHFCGVTPVLAALALSTASKERIAIIADVSG